MYLLALHAVSPKMYDLSDAVGGGEFTTTMLLVAIGLESVGLVIFGTARGSHSGWPVRVEVLGPHHSLPWDRIVPP